MNIADFCGSVLPEGILRSAIGGSQDSLHIAQTAETQ